MPRASSNSVRPSAAGKYARTRAGSENGKVLMCSDVCTTAQLSTLIADCVDSGGSVTINRTLDGHTLTVTFFIDGTRYPWYIGSTADWQEMVQTIEA